MVRSRRKRVPTLLAVSMTAAALYGCAGSGPAAVEGLRDGAGGGARATDAIDVGGRARDEADGGAKAGDEAGGDSRPRDETTGGDAWARNEATAVAERFAAAYRAADAKAVRAILAENYRRLKDAEPERIEAEMNALAATNVGVDLTGPALTYLVALQSRGALPSAAAATLDELFVVVDDFALNPASELPCLLAQQRLLAELAQGGGAVSARTWLESLACDGALNMPDPLVLGDNLVLEAIDAPGSFAYLFDPPPGIAPGFTARIDPEPPSPIVFSTDGRQLALQTLPLREVPSDSRTQIYTITLTSGGVDHAYDVVLPVNLGMDVPVLPVLLPGSSLDVPLRASGGPLDCSALPSGVQVPCGPMSWQWIPDASGGPLPAGVTLDVEPDGNAELAGTVQVGAVSSAGRLRLEQAGIVVESARLLTVPVHLPSASLTSLLGPHALTRGETFSLRLPDPLGGDGGTYQWSFAPGSPPLPPALGLVQRDGAMWLEGRVDDSAPLDTASVGLRVQSPLTAAPTIFTLQVVVGHELRVWTQNTFLRPPDVFPASFYVEAGAYLLSPIHAPLASALLAAAGGVEAIYDGQVANTDEDNEERLGLILDRAAEFDIVALQEVFGDRIEQVEDEAWSRGFFALGGPAGRTFRLPVDLATGAVNAALPLQNSGLVLLVRRDLHTPAVPIGGPVGQALVDAMRLTSFGHASVAFGTCNGFMDSGSDCLSRKGFTVSRVRVGGNPDEFLFVVNTHLDAGGGSGDAAARATQLAQIAGFVAGATDGVHPILFMGDFNIAAEVGSPPMAGPELATLVGTLGGVDLYRLAIPLTVGATVGYTVDSGVNAYAHHWGGHDDARVQERLDFLRVVQGTGFRLTLVSIAVMGDALDRREEPRTKQCFNPEIGENGWVESDSSLRCYFSDHYGVEAVLRLDRVPPP